MRPATRIGNAASAGLQLRGAAKPPRHAQRDRGTDTDERPGIPRDLPADEDAAAADGGQGIGKFGELGCDLRGQCVQPRALPARHV
jgi:hypothetical protein